MQLFQEEVPVVGESRPSTSQAPSNQDSLGLDVEDLYVKYKVSPCIPEAPDS